MNRQLFLVTIAIVIFVVLIVILCLYTPPNSMSANLSFDGILKLTPEAFTKISPLALTQSFPGIDFVQLRKKYQFDLAQKLLKQYGGGTANPQCPSKINQYMEWVPKHEWQYTDGSIRRRNDSDGKYWDSNWKSRSMDAFSDAMKVQTPDKFAVPAAGCCGALQGVKLAYAKSFDDRIYDLAFNAGKAVPQPNEGIDQVKGAGTPGPIANL